MRCVLFRMRSCDVGVARRPVSRWLVCLCVLTGWVSYSTSTSGDEPAEDPSEIAGRWVFEDAEAPFGEALAEGRVEVVAQGPAAPEFPDFPETNHAVRLQGGASLRVDDPEDGRFDFDHGDEITLEAWVHVENLHGHAYLIGKGRTHRKGFNANNQNWALRLSSQSGVACVNFLFRSRAGEGDNEASGGWHRWTTKQGFVPGSGWHHVAVTYRFGEPDSIRGYLDGERLAGRWDMDGPTVQPPVVDDDQVWIGSSMGGLPANSLDGLIDEVAIHRQVLAPEVLQARFRYKPQPIGAPEVPPGKVVVQLFGPIGGIGSIPKRTGSLLTEWTQEGLGLVELPHRYDDWGIREDWGKTLLVRATAEVEIPAGKRQLLVRSRGLSRLWIDDQIVVTTPPQKNRSGAHHVVDPLPEVPVAGMRPHAMNDQESVVSYDFDGSPKRVVFEAIVGGPRYRLAFGETCVAIDAGPGTMFTILGTDDDVPLTDAGWQRFADQQSDLIERLDVQRRHQVSRASDAYWQRRHAYAAEHLIKNQDAVAPRSIDGLLEARRREATRAVTAGESADAVAFYREKVAPIFAQHCDRCHAAKQQGGLNVRDRKGLLAGGESGEAAIVPGDPEASYLYELVSADADAYRMPPKNEGLSAEQLATIREWIASGAVMATEAVAEDLQPTEIVSDEIFLRRAYLDTVGVAPTLDEAVAFLKDDAPDRRSRLIQRLLDDPRVADNWMGYWQDVLAENPNLLKPTLNNTGPFRWWMEEALRDNKPLDRFAMELLMMRGSRWSGGTAGFAVASQNDVPMAAKAFVAGSAFLGVQMKCARCHDAPYHSWKQGDLFQLAAMLERKPIQLPASSTVPAAFFEDQPRQALIEVTLRPGQTVAPEWPLEGLGQPVPSELLERPEDPRERMAARITLSRRFAEMMANRIWGRLMGMPLVDPVDDWEGNPPSDPQLLAYLTDELIACGYDLRAFCALVMNSQAYQRTAIDRECGADPGQRFYQGPYRRRMTAEQIVDTALHAVGLAMDTERLTLDVEGTLPAETFLDFGFPERAWELTTLANERDRPSLALPRTQAVVDVLKAFGWRNARPEPIAERDHAANVLQPGVLANGALGTRLTRLSDASGVTQLALREQPVEGFVEQLFLTMLSRYPTAEERESFVRMLRSGYEQRRLPADQVPPPEPTKRYRYVSWSNHLNTEANKIKTEIESVVRAGPQPTRYLTADWRQRAEDAVWTLLNAPEAVMIP